MINIINRLNKELKSKFYFDYDMSKHVWFRAGGKTSIFCIVHNQEELIYILKNIDNVPYETIGAGSNFLIRDNGFKGIIFKLGKNFNKIDLRQKHIEVGAGILDINLAKFAEINNIKNFEFYTGIPGSIGGAVKMNAGCFGFETKDLLHGITTIDSKGKLKYLNSSQLNLSYRNSSISKGDIIISANFNYVYGNKKEILKKIKEIKNVREKTQPLKNKTSGSSFKNPSNKFAAELIEKSDCKGLNIGDAYISEKHANFIINRNKATATDIEKLGNKIIEKVFKKFKIKLEWEIKIIGEM